MRDKGVVKLPPISVLCGVQQAGIDEPRKQKQAVDAAALEALRL